MDKERISANIYEGLRLSQRLPMMVGILIQLINIGTALRVSEIRNLWKKNKKIFRTFRNWPSGRGINTSFILIELWLALNFKVFWIQMKICLEVSQPVSSTSGLKMINRFALIVNPNKIIHFSSSQCAKLYRQ